MRLDEAKILIEEINRTKYQKTALEEASIARIKDNIKSGKPLEPKQSLTLQSIYRNSQQPQRSFRQRV